jgi:hypothetical protein
VFALNARIFLKTGAFTEFTKIVEKEVFPLLRKQAGFVDALTLLIEGRNESAYITLWDSKENADAYTRDSYPEVLSALWRVLDGNPSVQTYKVAASTLNHIPIPVAAIAG